MRRWTLFVVTALVCMMGCTTVGTEVREGKEKPPHEGAKVLDLAPANKEELLVSARRYLEQRDYANALINIVRAERAEGDAALDGEISRFKNNLIENMHSRALDETAVVEVGKGMDVPLEYMVFYTDGEFIYPAFNVPVTFGVQRGDAQITARSYTDPNGVAACNVIKVDALDGGEVVIRAGISLDIEGEIFTIGKLEKDFTLYHESIKERTISFVVFEQNIDRIASSSTAGAQIEQVFLRNGFSLVHGIHETDEALFTGAAGGDASCMNVYRDSLDAQLIAFTLIESVFSSKVAEGYYFAKSRISLAVVDVSTLRVVFTSVVEDVKGAGNTEEKAGERAIMEATNRFVGQLENEILSLDMQ